MFLGTAARGALLDMKPASAQNFTKLIFNPAGGSISFTSYETPCLNLPSKLALHTIIFHYTHTHTQTTNIDLETIPQKQYRSPSQIARKTLKSLYFVFRQLISKVVV
jgi:hypothetical protein